MKIFSFLLISLLLWGCSEKEPPPAPNIIYILADDLGYGELGVYGQEIIETPHIETRHLLNNKSVAPHSNFAEGADPNDPKSYVDFNLNDYAPELMHTEALQFINQNKDNRFFLYYASPIPHLPLQAPKRWVEYYQKKLGPEKPYAGKGYFPNQFPRATYAGMISYLDEQVGELVATLKELGLYENTLIIFTSDNGPTYKGGADTPFFDSAKPFKTEFGWGKGFTHEGGIRVPMIATWPGKIDAHSTSDHISAFYDVLPTFAEIAHISSVPQNDGISFLPSLLGKKQPQHEYLYWEFPAYTGQQAVRMGNWKAIRQQIFDGNLEIELFNLETDLQEQNNIAHLHPAIVKKMEKIMKEAHEPAFTDKFKMEALGDVKHED